MCHTHLKVRMREIQGAIAVSAIFQMLLGYAGLIGFLLRLIFTHSIRNIISVDHCSSMHNFLDFFFLQFLSFQLRWITPLTITPAVAMIGIALFDAASYNAQGNWGIAIL